MLPAARGSPIRRGLDGANGLLHTQPLRRQARHDLHARVHRAGELAEQVRRAAQAVDEPARRNALSVAERRKAHVGTFKGSRRARNFARSEQTGIDVGGQRAATARTCLPNDSAAAAADAQIGGWGPTWGEHSLVSSSRSLPAVRARFLRVRARWRPRVRARWRPRVRAARRPKRRFRRPRRHASTG